MGPFNKKGQIAALGEIMLQKGRRESEEYLKVLRRHTRGPTGCGDSGWRGGQMGDSRWEKWADG